MSAIVFDGVRTDADYLAWLRAHPHGYILNRYGAGLATGYHRIPAFFPPSPFRRFKQIDECAADIAYADCRVYFVARPQTDKRLPHGRRSSAPCESGKRKCALGYGPIGFALRLLVHRRGVDNARGSRKVALVCGFAAAMRRPEASRRPRG
ncbi:hypothetical protein M3I53_06365 [Paraburkholderia sp. CNPSo 3272]|uniref:hypothetical protein n=1 Tax=Paraburkholderia sp. CNPSo 3272 TaxID=2940931 RepID=UPI0020B69073|nr:hypothetical protein [Paraburkholderia sp. CNPSo 3272]MCP3722758.1 hypothetical protein [Paraburkholderia sp. CNPSo 3272]